MKKFKGTVFKDVIEYFRPVEWVYDKLETYYYNTKYTIVNFVKYAKIVSRYRPWDSGFILEMMEFQLKDLCNTIEHYGNETDEGRLPKVVNMKRAIELLHNHNEDNYIDRSGYIPEATKFRFVDCPESEYPGFKELKFDKVPGYEDYNQSKVFKDAQELEEKEWAEIFELLKDMRGWWD